MNQSKAVFEKPDIAKLSKDGYCCVDMHCHSNYSDAIQSIESICKKCRKLKIGVAITDHNEVKGALKAVKQKGIIVIPGIETTSSEGIHTLFYFYSASELEEFHKNVIVKNLSENPFSDIKIGIAEIIEKSKSYNCLISAAHPFSAGNTGIHKFIVKKEYRKLLDKIDFIEAINGSNLHKNNKKAVSWANALGKNFTGGSDSHSASFIGDVITAADSNDFLDSIQKKSIVVGKEVNSMLLVFRHILKLRMFSKFPKFYIKKLIRERL